MQSSGRVDDEPALAAAARGRECLLGDRRGRARVGLEVARADVARELLELRARGRPVDVRAREQRRAPVLLEQAARELRGRRRLARALQADEHDHRGAPVRRDRVQVAAEHRHELVVHDLREGLAGVQAARDFLAERAIAHAIDERLRNRHCDVRLEQRHAYRTHGLTHILFSDAAAPGHAL